MSPCTYCGGPGGFMAGPGHTFNTTSLGPGG